MELPNLLVKDVEKKTRSLVKSISYSGDQDLDRELINQLKAILKSSGDGLTLLALNECLKHLQKDHSQVRLSTFKLIDYLFQKSHIIRTGILDRMETLIPLTLGIRLECESKLNLPPPKRFASLLQEYASKSLHRWHSDFGGGYERLRYIYKHLKEHKLVDFNQFRVHSIQDRLKQQKKLEMKEMMLNNLIRSKLSEFNSLAEDVEQLLVQIESLIDILVPVNEDMIPVDSSVSNENSSNNMSNRHGISNISASVSIEFEPYVELERNSDNKEVIEELKSLKKQLTDVKLVKLVSIEKTISKRGEQHVDILKRIIDLKTKSTSLVMKLSELKVVNDKNNNERHELTLDRCDSESDDDEFEEVPEKEDLESYIPKSMRYEYGLVPIGQRELNQANRRKITEESFDPETPIPSTSSADNSSTLKLPCNAKLESGKLCPRRDKFRCPFHGKIIPRDHRGIPLNEDDRAEEERRMKLRNNTDIPDWQDPELLRDIRIATGIDLTMPIKGRKSKKKRSKLLDTRTCDVTPKQRLKKKLSKLRR